MLKYIEKLAENQPDLASSKRLPTDLAKWGEFENLRFDANQITEFRFGMIVDIRNAGEKQKREKAAKQPEERAAKSEEEERPPKRAKTVD